MRTPHGPPTTPFADAITRPLVFDGTSTPVKAALFLIICAAWILPGLIGHDPWKPDEARVFGVVYNMLREGQWLLPAIAGQWYTEYPPLYYWVAAIFATLTAPVLALHDGARLASGFFVALAFFYTHKTATRLFDARAGRIAVVLLIGCIGMLVRAHEMNPEIAGFAGMAIALYGLTRIRSEPKKGGITTGLGMGVMALSVGIVPALLPLLTAVLLLAFLRDWRNTTFRRGIAIAGGVSVPFLLTFPVLLALAGSGISPWQSAIWGIPFAGPRAWGDYTHFVTILPWYALPALPFALWHWRQNRHRLRERVELALPLCAFVVLLIGLSLSRKSNDAVAMVLLIPLALAAAGALDGLPRGLASFMDWFGLVFFGTLTFLLWTLWAAALTGIPRNFARWAAREAPGFEPQFGWIAFAIAATLTVIWAYAVCRAHRNNRRAIVNWTAGLTMFWVLLNLFGLPAADHVRSYRSVAAHIARVAPPNQCIATIGLGDAQRATIHYFSSFKFVAIETQASKNCGALLTQGTKENVPLVPFGWRLEWEGARPGDQVERLRVYRRVTD